MKHIIRYNFDEFSNYINRLFNIDLLEKTETLPYHKTHHVTVRRNANEDASDILNRLENLPGYTQSHIHPSEMLMQSDHAALAIMANIRPASLTFTVYVWARDAASGAKAWEDVSPFFGSAMPSNIHGDKNEEEMMQEEDTPYNVPHIAPLLGKVVERIETLYNREDRREITGVATGFIDLDTVTGGLQSGELIIVGGRPGMGKTAFATNIVEHVALELKKPVVFFSMAMSGTQLATRMIGSVGRLNQHILRTGQLEDDDWPRMTHALGLLNEAPLFIDEATALNEQELCLRVRRLHQQNGGLGLIVIDYLQLMSAPTDGISQSCKKEFSEISRSLKALAKELDVPVIVLSQVNRCLEHRPNKRPVMSDLRVSGVIEDIADLILFIYRDEAYNPDSSNQGVAEIIIAKQHNGPTRTVKLTFRSECARFDNYAEGSIKGEK